MVTSPGGFCALSPARSGRRRRLFSGDTLLKFSGQNRRRRRSGRRKTRRIWLAAPWPNCARLRDFCRYVPSQPGPRGSATSRRQTLRNRQTASLQESPHYRVARAIGQLGPLRTISRPGIEENGTRQSPEPDFRKAISKASLWSPTGSLRRSFGLPWVDAFIEPKARLESEEV